MRKRHKHTPATNVRCPQGCSEQDLAQWQLEQLIKRNTSDELDRAHFEAQRITNPLSYQANATSVDGMLT